MLMVLDIPVHYTLCVSYVEQYQLAYSGYVVQELQDPSANAAVPVPVRGLAQPLGAADAGAR